MVQKTHGEAWPTCSVEYVAYRNAKARCNNPNDPAYPNYGGRGIEFRFQTYQEFLNILGRKPTAKHTLNRIKNDGHYEIGNVEWADRLHQTDNRRNTTMIAAYGKTQSLSAWAIELALDAHTVQNIRCRIVKGWTPTDALLRPPRKSPIYSKPHWKTIQPNVK